MTESKGLTRGREGKQVVEDEQKSNSFVEFAIKNLHCWRSGTDYGRTSI